MKRCPAMRWTLCISLLIAVALTGRAVAEDPAPSPADEERRSQVFATVGSESITVGELEDLIAARSPYARKRLLDEEALRELADAQVQRELYYQGAEKLGYGDDPEVERFVSQTMVKLFVRKEFEETATPDDVPASEVARYYEEHADEFRRPEMRRARHILLGSKSEAAEVRKLLLEDDTQKFRTIAKERSLDTETKVRGGDLLYFTSDGALVGRDSEAMVDDTLAKAAFALKKTGELSPPLDLGDGKWSVLELSAIRPERVQGLEEADAGIRRKLWREQREAELESLISKLRAELEPQIHAERLDAIVLEKPNEPIEPPNQ